MTIARRLIVGGVATFTPPTPGPIAPSGSRITIPSSAYNAFPGLDLDGTDRILVYRHGSAHNSPGATVDVQISADGVTWPGSGTVIGAGVGSNDVRDPCILVMPSGRWIFGFDRRNPYNSLDVQAYAIYSDNQGSSWSTPVAMDDLGGDEGSVISSQPIMDGTDIIMPAYGTDGSDFHAGYWRSTDNGATWGSFYDIAYDAGVRDYQETQIRILDSGLWVALLRSESNHHTWRTTSADGLTWSTPTDVVNMTGRPDFVEYRPGRLVLFGRYNTAADSPGHYSVSFDEGATWSTPAEIDAGDDDLWMYGAPIVTSTGAVEIVYCLESNGSTCGMYRRVFTD